MIHIFFRKGSEIQNRGMYLVWSWELRLGLLVWNPVLLQLCFQGSGKVQVQVVELCPCCSHWWASHIKDQISGSAARLVHAIIPVPCRRMRWTLVSVSVLLLTLELLIPLPESIQTVSVCTLGLPSLQARRDVDHCSTLCPAQFTSLPQNPPAAGRLS